VGKLVGSGYTVMKPLLGLLEVRNETERKWDTKNYTSF
jgi:hypothetical protein